MQHEQEYLIIISDENIPIIIINSKNDIPNCPTILYDGGNHATFYRTPKQTILLDYINPQIQNILQKAEFAIIMETSSDGENIVQDYKAKIKIVKHNPITDGLI